MLEERIDVYSRLKDDKSKLYAYNYKTEKEYKQEFIWMGEVDAVSLQQKNRDLNQGFQNFYRRIRTKSDKVGFPKFKAKHNKQSYRTNNNNDTLKVDFDKRKLKLPKVGWVNYRDDRQFDGKIKSITVSMNTSKQLFASVLVEDYELIPKKININMNSKSIGFDMSAKDFLVSSEDSQFTNPRFFRDKELKLKRLNQSLSRKQKGSNNRAKARLKLAKFYQHQSNCKKDWCQKLTTNLVNEYDIICIEDLNIKSMTKNKKLKGLSKTITRDFSWSQFTSMLDYKCDWYGKHLIKVGRFYPSSKTCSTCGAINNELTLNDRTWTCQTCLTEHDRDKNASYNIKREGLRLLDIESNHKQIPQELRKSKPVIIENLFSDLFNEQIMAGSHVL